MLGELLSRFENLVKSELSFAAKKQVAKVAEPATLRGWMERFPQPTRLERIAQPATLNDWLGGGRPDVVPDDLTGMDRVRAIAVAGQNLISTKESRKTVVESIARKHGFLRDLDLPSKLEQEVQTRFPGGNRSPEDTKKFISGLDVKPKEIEWTGVGEFIDKKISEGKPITKAALMEHLQQAKLPIEVREYPVIRNSSTNVMTARSTSLRMPGEAEPGTYNELTLRLKGPDVYTGGHQADMQSNTLAYILQEQRIAENGKKYAVSDNVQSDWATDVRAEGEKGKLPKGYEIKPVTTGMTFGNRWGLYKDGEMIDLNSSKEPLIKKVEGKVSPFPFKGTWTDLMMKAWMKDAIDKGLDGIAWGTGEQVNKWRGIGGSWNVSNLYDKKLVDDANRIMKKGKLGKVEEVGFDTGKNENVPAELITWEYFDKANLNTTLRSYADTYKRNGKSAMAFFIDVLHSREKSEIFPARNIYEPLHSITFTPELKEAFKKGKVFMYGLGAGAIATAAGKTEE